MALLPIVGMELGMEPHKKVTSLQLKKEMGKLLKIILL
jgi:hypothetical protein